MKDRMDDPLTPRPRAADVNVATKFRSADDAWRALRAAACAPYRSAGHFAWHFARGKLRIDPVFRHLLREGLIPPDSRVLDIGCGQGLLASLLAESERLAREGAWPAAWGSPPRGVRVTGIERMPRDVERARRALGNRATFVCGDMRELPFPAADVVVLLDVLHYIPIAEQDRVLGRIRALLPERGRLLLRVGDAAARVGFATSQWVDRIVTRVRGHRVSPTFCRPLPIWVRRLKDFGFDVEARPMSSGTPFANVLLVARATAAGGPR
ncbi:MAG TPA: class I SAM-dependent methyltransferase [Burkholderiaceae bacterium]|nr:class I SAM-dependent methyltransferase [Burkholderiaceae bacterium]